MQKTKTVLLVILLIMTGINTKILFETKEYLETFFRIKTKDRGIQAFVLNPVQADYLKNRSFTTQGNGKRDIILKGRQHGFTTLEAAEFLHDSMTNEGISSVIVGHDDEAMSKLLDNVRLMYESVPEHLRPEIKYDNKGELYFPKLNSRIYISTYRKLKLRSQTVNNLLMTEVAFWKIKDLGDMIAGMTESVPIDGNIAIESTPNGIGGYFYEQVQAVRKGESVYKLFVYTWFVNPEYRILQSKWHLLPPAIKPGDNFTLDKQEQFLMERWNLDIEQIIWRRYKMFSMGDMRINEQGIKFSRRFAQEYECSFVQSGMSVFDASYLTPCTNFQKPITGAIYIHGADTAEGIEGGDFNVMYTMNYETGEVVNKIRGLWKPSDFAYRIHEIGMEYGGLIGIENNNTGHAVLLKLVDLFEEEAIKLGKGRIKDGYKLIPYRIFSDKKRYGWTTNQLSRKTMFVEGEQAIRDGSIKLAFQDKQGIEEFVACQYSGSMKEEAPPGMHDDCVMALLITWQMRKYYHYYFEGKK